MKCSAGTTGLPVESRRFAANRFLSHPAISVTMLLRRPGLCGRLSIRWCGAAASAGDGATIVV